MALTPFSRRDPGLFDPFERQLGMFDPFSNRLAGSWDPFSALRTMDPFAIMEHGPARQMARDVSAVANTRVDWVETPEAHVFKADLPGLKKEEIKIEIEDGRTLKISGERKKEETQESDRWYRVERAQGSFMRSFRLPENAKVDEVNAKVDHGVLTVTVPKTQTEKRDVRAVQIS